MAFDNIQWTIAEGLINRAPFKIRFREISSLFPKKVYPTRVSLTWSLKLPSIDALGTQAELAFIQIFEKNLLSVVEKERQSVLTTVYAHKNTREFVFHTKDHEAFIQQLLVIAQPVERFPIQVQSFDDENWLYEKNLMRNLGIV